MAAAKSGASKAPQRREEIQHLVRAQGYVSIEDLAEHFGKTPQTIRRDINALAEEGLVRRHHGGAGLPSTVENVVRHAA
jgi:DeoR family glycerol-3-phosphate regulon repressor